MFKPNETQQPINRRMPMDIYEPPGDPGDPGDQNKDRKNQEEPLGGKNTGKKNEHRAKRASDKEEEPDISMHTENDANDNDDNQFVYSNEEDTKDS